MQFADVVFAVIAKLRDQDNPFVCEEEIEDIYFYKMQALALVKRWHWARTTGEQVRRRRTEQEATRAPAALKKEQEQVTVEDEQRRCGAIKAAILREIKNPPSLKNIVKPKPNPTTLEIPHHQNLRATERPKHINACAIVAYAPLSIQSLHKNPNNKASIRGAIQPPAALLLKGRYDTAYLRVQAIEESEKGKENNNVFNAWDTHIPEELKEDGKAQTREEEWLPEAMRDEVRKLEDLELQLNHVVKPEIIQEELVEREWKHTTKWKD